MGARMHMTHLKLKLQSFRRKGNHLPLSILIILFYSEVHNIWGEKFELLIP